LMGVERIDAIAREMMTNGVRGDLPVALVRWATTGRQETLIGILENIAQRVAENGFEAPAVAVFGDVVRLRKDLKWYEDRPLSGKRIVVTRTRKHADVLSNQLRALGADVLELPTIRIEPPTDLREFGELVQDAHTYDWIVFSSPNGVDAFFEMFFKLYDDAREIGGAKIAAIGPVTAQRVRDFHLHVDLDLPWPKGMRVASIGPITSKTATDHGLEIDIEARRHNIEGLVEAIRAFFKR